MDNDAESDFRGRLSRTNTDEQGKRSKSRGRSFFNRKKSTV